MVGTETDTLAEGGRGGLGLEATSVWKRLTEMTADWNPPASQKKESQSVTTRVSLTPRGSACSTDHTGGLQCDNITLSADRVVTFDSNQAEAGRAASELLHKVAL